MLYNLAIIFALLAAGIFCGISWRGMKSSAIIANPFPELPDDAFQACANFVKKRYIYLFISSVAVCIAIICIYMSKIVLSATVYRLGVLGIIVAIFFFAFATFERKKAEEILEAHKHSWVDLTYSIAAHKP